MHGCPNETGKVGRLTLPAALTQQHSNHFPRAKPGSAQRNTHKLGWEYQHCIGQQNHLVFRLNTGMFRNAGIFRLHIKTRSTAQLWSPCYPFCILHPESMSSSVLTALGTKGFQLQAVAATAPLSCPVSSVCSGNPTCLDQEAFQAPSLTHQLLSWSWQQNTAGEAFEIAENGKWDHSDCLQLHLTPDVKNSPVVRH